MTIGAHAVRLAEEGADIIGVDICGQISTVSYPMVTRENLDDTVALVEKHGRTMVAAVASSANPTHSRWLSQGEYAGWGGSTF